MEGHIKGQIDRAYFKTDAKKLKESYLKGIDLLFINEPIVIDKTSEKVQELEAALKSKDDMMKTLKSQVESNNEDIANFKKTYEKLMTNPEFHKDILE